MRDLVDTIINFQGAALDELKLAVTWADGVAPRPEHF